MLVVHKVKLTGATGRHAAYALGTDVHGSWLFSPAGSLFRGEIDGQVGWCDAAQDPAGRGRPLLQLMPTARWWVACWVATHDGVLVTADISTPAARVESGWRFVDLELDPFRHPDGRLGVEDEDEFAAACVAGQIDADSEAGARREVVDLMAALDRRIEPYGRVGEEKLAQAVALGLPPLTDRHRLSEPPSLSRSPLSRPSRPGGWRSAATRRGW